VDDDGDIDVLSASVEDSQITWYENDGNESFSRHTITDNADRAYSVYAVDVDGDGDIDVLSASFHDDKIAWYENDGNENFSHHTITVGADGANSVYAVDVDGDGNIDVLSASRYDDKIAWYENDGNENFISHTITTNANYAVSVHAIDVDGDGDMDVLSASSSDDKIAWYENDGNENFSQHTIVTDALGAISVYAVDVDGDGDIDVLSASYLDDKIAWYENLTPPIPVELTSFTASTSQGKVTLNWTTATETNNSGFEIERKLENYDWEKIGFVEGHGTTTEIQSYQFIDNIIDIQATSLSYRLKQIDYDGSYEYSDVVEVKNLAPTDFALHQNYPNPFNPVTTISYSLPVKSQVGLVVYNTLGESVTQLVNEEKEPGRYEVEFDATELTSGIYFYRLQAGNFVVTKKMVLMK